MNNKQSQSLSEKDFDDLWLEIGQARNKTLTDPIQNLNLSIALSEENKETQNSPLTFIEDVEQKAHHFSKIMNLGESMLFNQELTSIQDLFRSKNKVDPFEGLLFHYLEIKLTDEPTSSLSKFELFPADIFHGRNTCTTLMIKNIPNKYTQKMILERVNQDFDGLYDFFYLPIDYKVTNIIQNKCNVGYAFINFIDSIFILKFFEEFDNKRWEFYNSLKVTYGRIQGKENLAYHFSSSSVMSHNVRVFIQKVKPLLLDVAQPSNHYLKAYKANLKAYSASF